METIDVGFLSIIPPIIAITLALISKEVISSLLIGILSGALIYAINTGGGIVEMSSVAFGVMADTVGSPDKFNIILFLIMLGMLVYVVTRAGGSRAYGNWASQKLKTKRSASFATCFLGMLIFIDDYFNCLTVGTVMKPVTDKYKMSRAKLAYLIDATAAPICIIAPISSWAAAVGSTLYETGAFSNEMSAFVATIPYNLYALLTIFMAMMVCLLDLDFGGMEHHELLAKTTGDLGAVDKDELDQGDISDKGSVWDLIIPIGSLIFFSILCMLWDGGFWSEGLSFSEAFGSCDPSFCLVLGSFWALVVTFLLFVPRKLVTYRQFFDGAIEGGKSMLSACVILTLAWTIGSLCQNCLGTGIYVGELVEASHLPTAMIPAVVFLVAAGLSFSIGTAWGTFGIFIPIVVFICQNTAPEIITVTLSAALAGSVFGDHCSPISDTTILSSAGAGCDHLTHVSTQIPYAVTVASVCFVGYLIAGFSNGSIILTLGCSFVLLGILLFVFHRRSLKREVKLMHLDPEGEKVIEAEVE